MKIFSKGFVLWAVAALFGVGALVAVSDAGLVASPMHVASAVLLAVLIVGALYLVLRAIGARQSNVIEHGPEMSSLAFPPSSFRK